MINVLLTSVGRRVELVRGFRTAYERLGLEGNIVATDIDQLAPALQVVDCPYLVPAVSSPDYVEALESICQREYVDLILPLIDPDISVLARHKQRLGQTGADVGVVDAPAAAISGDKWLAYLFFRDLGLATPENWLTSETDANQLGYPLFIKPRNGSAGHHAFPVRNDAELRFFCSYVPNPIVQEQLPGPEVTTDVVCGCDGQVLAIVSRQRIAVRGGEAIKSVTIHDPRIQEACLEIARALPARGPITVQCMMKDDTPHFIEINARLGGGIPLAMAAGVDVPGLLLSSLSGVGPLPPDLPSYHVGLHMTRCDESFFITEEDCAEIARDCVRS